MGVGTGVGRRVGAAAAVAAVTVAVAGCGSENHGNDLAGGKQLFVDKCGSCHTLARAGTKGTTGPNLDEAFQQARKDGFGESTFKGVVYGQIRSPANDLQVDPATEKPVTRMPGNLVKGDQAWAVASYVSKSAGKAGKDTGVLANVGAAAQKALANAAGGVLKIPANAQGQLLYDFKNAQAPAGQIDIQSQNPSATPHDIAISGPGVSEQAGKIVQGGGVSDIKVNLKPGKYQFYCTVPGHRAGGMEGTLTVK